MGTLVLKSNLAAHIDGFITYKRAIGYRYDVGAAILKRFDEFCFKYHQDEKFFHGKLCITGLSGLLGNVMVRGLYVLYRYASSHVI